MVKVTYKPQEPVPVVRVGNFEAMKKGGAWLWKGPGGWYAISAGACQTLLEAIVNDNQPNTCACGEYGGCVNCPPNSCRCKE